MTNDNRDMAVSEIPDDQLTDPTVREHFAVILENYAKMMRAGELRQFAFIGIKQEGQEATAALCADNDGFGIFIAGLAGVMGCNCDRADCDVAAFKKTVSMLANAFNTGTLSIMPTIHSATGKPN